MIYKRERGKRVSMEEKKYRRRGGRKKERPEKGEEAAFAKMKALDLLLLNDRSEKMLRDKLKTYELPADAIDEAIEYVKSFNYVNDIRFAKNYVRRMAEFKSLTEIKFYLAQKGVDKDDIDEGVLMAGREMVPKKEEEVSDEEAMEALHEMQIIAIKRIAGIKDALDDLDEPILKNIEFEGNIAGAEFENEISDEDEDKDKEYEKSKKLIAKLLRKGFSYNDIKSCMVN